MAKIKKTNIDSVRQPVVRKSGYDAPVIRSSSSEREIPKEYRTFKRAPKKHGGFVFLLFLLFIATLAGWYYWNNQGGNSANRSLELTVAGPGKIISGDEVIYNVSYKNTDNVPLKAMKLSVFWPEGFYFDSASQAPTNDNAKDWLLPDLGPGQTANLEIKGQLVGKKDDELRTIFNLDYQPENFSSDFQEKITVTTKVIDHKLELNILAVAKTMVNVEETIEVKYKNLTDQPLNDLYIDVIYPDDLTIVSVEPEKEGDFWQVNLEPGEEKTIKVVGNFGLDSNTSQALVAEIGNMVNNDFRRLSRAKHDFIIVNPKFSLDLKVNGLNGDQAINWGDTLRYQLEVTNDSSAEVTDVQVSALLSGELLNWDSLDTVGSGDEGRIVWTSEQDQELANWPAGAKKVFTWEIKAINEPQPERLIENIIQINIAGLNDWQQIDTPSKLTVGESITFNSGVYWELGGRRVGSGLLPPRVGEETKYLVIWSLPSATGDFDEVKVETILPPNVTFANEADVGEGELDFDETDRSIVWQLNNFSDLLLPVTSSFMISVTPTEDDRGQAMTLLNAVTASAEGLESVVVRSKIIKTSDVVAETSEPIGIVQ